MHLYCIAGIWKLAAMVSGAAFNAFQHAVFPTLWRLCTFSEWRAHWVHWLFHAFALWAEACLLVRSQPFTLLHFASLCVSLVHLCFPSFSVVPALSGCSTSSLVWYLALQCWCPPLLATTYGRLDCTVARFGSFGRFLFLIYNNVLADHVVVCCNLCLVSLVFFVVNSD